MVIIKFQFENNTDLNRATDLETQMNDLVKSDTELNKIDWVCMVELKDGSIYWSPTPMSMPISAIKKVMEIVYKALED